MSALEKYLVDAKACVESTRSAELVHPERALVLADYLDRLIKMVEAALRRAGAECNCDIDPTLGLVQVCINCAIYGDIESV